MINPDLLFGRLGNRMFQGAYLMAQAQRYGTDYYFQDPHWFEDIEPQIKYLYGQGIEPIDMVAVHLRRGDYVGHKLYTDLTMSDYYNDAMNQFVGDTFLVFSDDIRWAKEYFDGRSDVEFCEESDPVKALNMMAGCKGIIMANSTFSWWAAYLSKAKVVAPKEWYTNGESIKLLDTWQKI